MLRRSILEISSRRSFGRISPQVTTQIPVYLSSRKEFSVASQLNSSNKEPPNSGNNLSKVIIGSIALGAAGLTAYQTGYIQKVFTKEQKTDPAPIIHEEPQQSNNVNQDLHDIEPVKHVENVQDSEVSSQIVDDDVKKSIETDPYYSKRDEEKEKEKPESENLPISKPDDATSESEDKLTISDHSISTSDNLSVDSVETKKDDLKPTEEQQEVVQITSIPARVVPIIEENLIKSEPNKPEDIVSDDIKQPNSILDEYYIRDNKAEQTPAASLYLDKDIAEAVKGSDDIYVSKDGKVVLDILEAIHTAEKRQADLDAHIFSEEKRLMKEKYEKELKDARARELMYAERETILDKELHKEKIKAAAALKSLQEMLEEEFRVEIEKKETEAEMELNKLKDLAKAELAAAIASEKASQIEKMMEANLNINALCMAFYARSEEARHSHSVHKLALGALALEDALSKGLPIQKEIDALDSYIDGIAKDSLLGLVMESLPEETLKNGTDTILQLNHKFDSLKGTLRHFSLMPPGGGGILAHSLAYIASNLKVKEADKSGDGIESLINRVESLLADGKLLEAAETLENGLKGSQAAQVVTDWVQQARNRAITEQALTLLQSYATSSSLT